MESKVSEEYLNGSIKKLREFMGRVDNDDPLHFYTATLEYSLMMANEVLNELVPEMDVAVKLQHSPRALSALMFMSFIGVVAEKHDLTQLQPTAFLELVIAEIEQLKTATAQGMYGSTDR